MIPLVVALAAQPLDYVEKVFGATNVNAVCGHGALTAGIAADGDLTVLSWPSPGFADQLAYLSSNDADARKQPHFGAPDGMGSYLGLLVGGKLVWLRDLPHQQRYSQPDAPVPVTTFTGAGFTVTLTDVVAPDADTLSRHVRVEGSGPTALVVYENLSPTLSRVPEVPIADWALDPHNDFLAVWQDGAIVHFHPADRARVTSLLELAGVGADVDFGPAEALMRQAAPEPALDLDAAYGPGVAALVTTSPPPAQHQVGADATPMCAFLDRLVDNVLALPFMTPVTPQAAAIVRCHDETFAETHGWLWRPKDALADVADGALEGSPIAAGQTNGALIAPLDANGEAEVVFAFGTTVAAARAALAATQSAPFAARLAASEKAAHDALAGALLPDPALGARVRAVALRALVNLYVARDRATGAFLASITRQPPYALDWPRDGAFLSLAAELAGRGDWVAQRAAWYASLIRTEPTAGERILTPDVPTDPDTGRLEFPAGAWETNYYVDGAAGGPIRFEIDNTALHVWATAAHAGALSGEERRAFISAVWTTDRAALELLARWKEKDDDLPAPANEDDNLALTSTLHGAVAVHAGLVAGARLARAAGDADAAARYLARARALGKAIDATYYDPATGLFRAARGLSGGPLDSIGGWATGWLIWPGRVLAPGDPRVEAQLAADLDGILAILRGEKEGGTYVAKNVVAAALYGKPDGARAKARQALALLADIATPDTDAFGEVYLSAGGQWTNVTATPHIWEGALFYLAAMALTDPTLFNRDEKLPLPGEGGGCSVGGGGGDGALVVLLTLALLARGARPCARRARGRTRRARRAPG